MVYNERFLIGLSLDHINISNVSFNNESNLEKEIASLQAALSLTLISMAEALPDYSYMMMYFMLKRMVKHLEYILLRSYNGWIFLRIYNP